MTLAGRRAAQRAAYNQGYRDAINARPPMPSDPLLSFYYMAGHEEGWPKRIVETIITTPRGPVRERCTIERAAYLMQTHTRLPGGRR